MIIFLFFLPITVILMAKKKYRKDDFSSSEIYTVDGWLFFFVVSHVNRNAKISGKSINEKKFKLDTFFEALFRCKKI